MAADCDGGGCVAVDRPPLIRPVLTLVCIGFTYSTSLLMGRTRIAQSKKGKARASLQVEIFNLDKRCRLSIRLAKILRHEPEEVEIQKKNKRGIPICAQIQANIFYVIQTTNRQVLGNFCLEQASSIVFWRASRRNETDKPLLSTKVWSYFESFPNSLGWWNFAWQSYFLRRSFFLVFFAVAIE